MNDVTVRFGCAATAVRMSGTVGYGKLSEQGFNIYANVEYQKNDPLYARDRNDRRLAHPYIEPVHDLAPLLRELDNDPTCIFWG